MLGQCKLRFKKFSSLWCSVACSFPITLRSIWLSRNRSVFDNSNPDISVTIKNVTNLSPWMGSCLWAWSGKPWPTDCTCGMELSIWVWNLVWQEVSYETALIGNWVVGFQRKIVAASSSTAVECWALRDGLQLALEWNLQGILVETDSMTGESPQTKRTGKPWVK